MWIELLCFFLGGGFLANAIPHFVNGVSGRPFQSPFASPPGKGLSSGPVNVFWGTANLVAAYALLRFVGEFHLADWRDAAAAGLGFFATGMFLGSYFGRFHGTGS